MIWIGLAPSIRAASSRDSGTPLKKFTSRITLNTGTAPGSTRAQMVLIMWSLLTTMNRGMMPPLNSMAKMTIFM